MSSKNPRIVARNMRWVSLGLGLCLVLVGVLYVSQLLSSYKMQEEHEKQLADLNSGMREIIVLRLDRQSDVYKTCADYLADKQLNLLSAYLSGASDLAGTADFTDAAWKRLFPDNTELSGLCDKLTATTAALEDDVLLSELTQEQQNTLIELFDHLSASLNRDSTMTTLPMLIGMAEPDTEAIQTEMKAINDLLDEVKDLLDSVVKTEDA